MRPSLQHPQHATRTARHPTCLRHTTCEAHSLVPRHQVGDRLHAVEHVAAAAAAPDARVHLPVVDGGVEAHTLRESGLELAAIRPPPVRSPLERCMLRCTTSGAAEALDFSVTSGRAAVVPPREYCVSPKQSRAASAEVRPSGLFELPLPPLRWMDGSGRCYSGE
jgi:hypothetical protein